MAKFDTQLKAGPQSPAPIRTITGANAPTTVTHEGGVGWEREPKGELFLLAVTNMVGEQTFYEPGKQRDERFVKLLHQIVQDDPDWVARLIPWLRGTANMRSASIMAAVEYVRAGGPHGASVVNDACQRADEPAEALAYYLATNQGRRAIAVQVRQGVAAAAKRLYTERAVLKYDTASHGIRMGDVLNLVHPDWDGENRALFDYILHRRHEHKPFDRFQALPVIANRRALEEWPTERRRALVDAELLKRAGVTWEWLSAWLPGGMDAAAWETVIPSMGYMALLRNLRNFDQAGVSQEVKARVAAKLTDPDEVRASRQFPIRFLSAYKAVANDYWRWPLGQAVDLSLANVPSLAGRTLVLVDLSASMISPLSDRSELERWEVATLFGSALAFRAETADLVGYSSEGHNAPWRGGVDSRRWSRIDVPRGGSLLPMMQTFRDCPSFNGGTETFATLAETYAGHDRVVLLTDEQAHDSGRYRLPDVPIYTFNLAGYTPVHMASGRNRFTFGGLTDAGFAAIAALEQRRTAGWPF